MPGRTLCLRHTEKHTPPEAGQLSTTRLAQRLTHYMHADAAVGEGHISQPPQLLPHPIFGSTCVCSRCLTWKHHTSNTRYAGQYLRALRALDAPPQTPAVHGYYVRSYGVPSGSTSPQKPTIWVDARIHVELSMRAHSPRCPLYTGYCARLAALSATMHHLDYTP